MSQIKLRQGTAAAWTSANPTLAMGEEGFETDTKKKKTGDGATAWASLAYNSAATGGGLLAANNLSDVASAATARTNLAVAPTASPTFTGTVTLPTGLTGLAKLTAGVVSAGASGTDYAPATSGSAILKGNGSGGFSTATAADVVAEPPSLHGLLGWAYPISAAGANTIIPTAGTVFFSMVYTPVAITVTNLWTAVVSAGGAGLTAAGFALYSSGGTLLQSTVATTGANLTQYQSTGAKSIAVTSQAFNAGDKFYVAWFFTGTTMPTMARAGNATAIYNLNLAAPNFRFGTADTGRTTSFPASMGTQSGGSVNYWAGVS